MDLLPLVDRENAIDWQLMLSGEWERPHLTKLLDLGKAAPPLQQAWGGIPRYRRTLGAVRAEGAAERHVEQAVAFEPDPQNYAQLAGESLPECCGSRIRALQLAATDRERTFSLFQRNPHNRGPTRVVDAGGAVGAVQGSTVDSLLDLSDTLFVIKVDVELHEPEDCGHDELLENNSFVMQIEIWDTPQEERREAASSTCRILFADLTEPNSCIDRARLFLRLRPCRKLSP